MKYASFLLTGSAGNHKSASVPFKRGDEVLRFGSFEHEHRGLPAVAGVLGFPQAKIKKSADELDEADISVRTLRDPHTPEQALFSG